MRRSFVTLAGLVALALVFGVILSVLFTPATEELASESDDTPEIVPLAGTESAFWPYLNTRHAFQKDSPINVVVRGNSTRVIDEMQNQTTAEWTAPPPDQAIKWRQNGWPDHYAYVHGGTGGEWIDMTAELQDGDYYGARYHARLYETPRTDEEWVLMQVHTEYFDWFLLRHTVTGTEQAQRHVEGDFESQSSTTEIRYTQLDNADSWDSDGRATVVEVALVLPILLLGTFSIGRWTGRLASVTRRCYRGAQRRLSWRHALLAGTIVGLIIGVRLAGIALERHARVQSMTTIATLLFPVLALGIPVSTYGIARGIDSQVTAALTAALALLVAISHDFVYVGGDVLPLAIIVHRAGLTVAVGLIAGGATRRTPRITGMLTSGAILWGGLMLVGVSNLI